MPHSQYIILEDHPTPNYDFKLCEGNNPIVREWLHNNGYIWMGIDKGMMEWGEDHKYLIADHKKKLISHTDKNRYINKNTHIEYSLFAEANKPKDYSVIDKEITQCFKLSCGMDTRVRNWLKQNGYTWFDEDDLTKSELDEQYLFVDTTNKKVTHCDGNNAVYRKHQFTEMDPHNNHEDDVIDAVEDDDVIVDNSHRNQLAEKLLISMVKGHGSSVDTFFVHKAISIADTFIANTTTTT